MTGGSRVASGVASPFLRNDVTAARSQLRTLNAQLLRARDFGIWSATELRRTDVAAPNNERMTVDVAGPTMRSPLWGSHRDNEAIFDLFSFGETWVVLATRKIGRRRL
jgi:hypothetical protein